MFALKLLADSPASPHSEDVRLPYTLSQLPFQRAIKVLSDYGLTSLKMEKIFMKIVNFLPVRQRIGFVRRSHIPSLSHAKRGIFPLSVSDDLRDLSLNGELRSSLTQWRWRTVPDNEKNLLPPSSKLENNESIDSQQESLEANDPKSPSTWEKALGCSTR